MAQPNTPLTLGSLFAGSGGFELGGILAGIQPIDYMAQVIKDAVNR